MGGDGGSNSKRNEAVHLAKASKKKLLCRKLITRLLVVLVFSSLSVSVEDSSSGSRVFATSPRRQPRHLSSVSHAYGGTDRLPARPAVCNAITRTHGRQTRTNDAVLE